MNDIPPAGPTRDERNPAMLAHLLGISTGFVGALVLWLAKKDVPVFVADEATEALNVQIKITVAIAIAASLMLKAILIGILPMPLVFLANFIFCLLAALSAARGQPYRYPFALRLVS